MGALRVEVGDLPGAVVGGAAHVRVLGREVEGERRIDRELVEAREENRPHRSIRDRARDAGARTRGLEPGRRVALGEREQPEATPIALLGMRLVFEDVRDDGGRRGTDVAAESESDGRESTRDGPDDSSVDAPDRS